MGSIPSQLNTSRLKVVNKLPDEHEQNKSVERGTTAIESPRIELESEKTSPKILVSIVDKTTVIISEGKSIATQTDNDIEENSLTECEQILENGVLPDKETPPDDTKRDICERRSPVETTTTQTQHDVETIEKEDVETIENEDVETVENEGVETIDKEDEPANDILNGEDTNVPSEEEEKGISIPVDDTDLDTEEKSDSEMDSESKKIIQTVSLGPPPNVPFEEIALNRYGKYKVRLESEKDKCTVSAVVFLDSGDAVLIDRSNQKLKFVDSKFQFISSHELPAKPWAVCTRGIDVYVTLGNTQIQHLTIEDMIIEPGEVFEIKGRCLGICLLGENLAVGLQIGEVCLLDFKGEVKGTIKLPDVRPGKPCNPWHLCLSNENNILVTDSDAGAVFCVSQKSELVFSFKGLSSPRATTIDYYGNILLVGRDKESGAVVTILHKDTELQNMLHIEQLIDTKNRILMTWNELEFVPYCISYRSDNVVVLGGIQEALKIMRLGWPEPISDDETE